MGGRNKLKIKRSEVMFPWNRRMFCLSYLSWNHALFYLCYVYMKSYNVPFIPFSLKSYFSMYAIFSWNCMFHLRYVFVKSPMFRESYVPFMLSFHEITEYSIYAMFSRNRIMFYQCMCSRNPKMLFSHEIITIFC